MKELNLDKAMVITFIIFSFFFIVISSSNHCIAIASCMHQTKEHSLYCAGHQCFTLLNSAILISDDLTQTGYISVFSEIPYPNPYQEPSDRPPSPFSSL